MPGTLDELLNHSAPETSSLDGEHHATLSAMVAEARRTVALERRRRLARRSVGAVGVVALMGLGTAAAAGVLGGPSPWGGPPDGDPAAQEMQVFEWTSTHPGGQQCVERLEARGLSEAQVADIKADLSDPQALLVKDDGAVRQEFLDEEWSDGSATDLAAMDAAYAEVARIDVTAGRGTFTDDQLTTDYVTGRTDELFSHVYWRVILDGIESDDAVAAKILGPLTACEVQE